MIGRAAQGRPWIFREIEHFLKKGTYLTRPTNDEIHETTIEHVKDLYDFYGDYKGFRFARKHISWFSIGLKEGTHKQSFYKVFVLLDFAQISIG